LIAKDRKKPHKHFVQTNQPALRDSVATANHQKIVRPQVKFFVPPKAQNLKLAPLQKFTRFGEISLLIVAARRRRSSNKSDHFGLAGFYTS